jgi:hypothetical protein
MLSYNRFRGLRGDSVIPSVILKPTHCNTNGGVGGAIRNLVTQVSIFVILINLININTVNALENKKTYQMEYLKQLDQSPDQYSCLTSLITMENAKWDIRAKNGSHHGLPQGRSKFLATADHKAQITWHIKYIKHRYGTDRFSVANACGAWAHWLMKGWH